MYIHSNSPLAQAPNKPQAPNSIHDWYWANHKQCDKIPVSFRVLVSLSHSKVNSRQVGPLIVSLLGFRENTQPELNPPKSRCSLSGSRINLELRPLAGPNGSKNAQKNLHETHQFAAVRVAMWMWALQKNAAALHAKLELRCKSEKKPVTCHRLPALPVTRLKRIGNLIRKL